MKNSPKLLSHFTYNVLGVVVPIGLTIVSTPIYLRAIGQERFGVIAMVWIVIGYFGLFDLGLSRGAANQIAKADTREASHGVFWAGWWTSLLFGIVGGAALWFGGEAWLTAPERAAQSLNREIAGALPWMACFIPFATANGILTGALEARHRFLTVNLVSIVGTVMFILFPLAVALTYSPSLAVLIPAALAARVITFVWLCGSVMGELEIRRVMAPARQRVKDLLGYSSWAAVSTTIGVMMASVDKILVGAVLGAASVAAYVIPYNVISKLGIVPTALLRAMFPGMSKATAADARVMEYAALRQICIAMTVLCALLALAVGALLRLWLRQQLPEGSIPVAIVLLVGLWFNALANVPYWSLQSQGRPNVVAKCHLVEVVPFVLALYFATLHFGLLGAAVAWSARMGIDFVLLSACSGYDRRAILMTWSGAAVIGVSTAVALLAGQGGLMQSTILVLLAIPVLALWVHQVDRALFGRLFSFARSRLSRTAA